MRDKFEIARQFLGGLRRLESLSPTQLAHYQAVQIERLCRHAALETSFNRERLGVLFEARDARSGRFLMENWREVPILRRAEAQSVGGALHAAHVPEAAGPPTRMTTSGSTGRPLEFYRSELSEIAGIALFERLLEWHDFDRSARLGSIRRDDELRGSLERNGLGWNLADPNAERYELSFVASTMHYVEWLRRIRPRHLMTTPSVVEGILTEMNQRGQPGVRLDRVLITSESPADDLSARVAESFGAKLVDSYGSRELGQIAVACPLNPAIMHTPATTILVEVVKDNGDVAEPGEMGAVVVTPFYNFATPLIRYDVGDLAIQGEARCACGRALPSIRKVLGRQNALFRLRGGGGRYPAGVDDVAKFVPLLQMQFVQTDFERLEVRYVPDPSKGEPDFQSAVAMLRERLLQELRVDFVIVDAIPRGAGGKFEKFVTRV